MESKIIAKFSSDRGEFRIVSKKQRGPNSYYIVERKHLDAIGQPSWRAEVNDDIDEPYIDMFKAIDMGKFQIGDFQIGE